jgi:ribonuclease G
MFGFLLRRNRVKREIIINAESLETRVALLENGRLEEFQVEHPTQERIVGGIYKGRVQNLEHDLQAAFVDIGLKKNAFLHYWDMIPDEEFHLDMEEEEPRRRPPRRGRYTNQEIERRYPPGSDIVVQVTKGPIGTKGPRVTANLSIPGRYLVMVPGSTVKGVSRKITDGAERERLKKLLNRVHPPEGIGLIVRTAGSGARLRNVVRDLASLVTIWQDLRKGMEDNPAPCCLYSEPSLEERAVRDWLTEDIDRIVIDDRRKYDLLREVAGRVSRRSRSRIHLYEGDLPIFDHYDIERQLDEAFQRKVNLKSGGYIVFDETEALIAVDVNTGRHKGKTGSQEDAILEVNLEAVAEVARQLRLRNIGGLVIIDLIDMKSRKHRTAVYKALKAEMKRDKARTNLLPISELGLLEMTRQRAEESVLSSLYVNCPYCHGHGTVKSPLGMSVDIQRQVSAIMRKQRRSGAAYDLQVTVHPAVLDRLRREDEQFLLDLEAKYAGKLSFRSDPTKHMECFIVANRQTGEALYSSADGKGWDR